MSIIRRLRQTVAQGVVAGSFFLTPAFQPAPPLLDQVIEQGELVIATQTGPTTYYRELGRETGFDFELAQSFADFLHVKLRVVNYDDLGMLLNDVRRGKVHLAAAGLSVTPERSRQFRFSSPYQQTGQEVIGRRNAPLPSRIEDLYGRRILVLANSSQEEYLQRLQQDHPQLEWESITSGTPLHLLQQFNEGQGDLTIVNTNAFQGYRSLFPELSKAFDIKESEPMAWAFQASEDASLFTMAELFIHQEAESGALQALQERFFDRSRKFDYVGARTFLAHLDSRLTQYEDDFRAVAHEVGMDWRLLAAIGYQESLWNPNAISPTGVRGLMQLTQQTAEEMGISDRRDPSQSIMAGARYFKKIYDRLPEDVTGQNRVWFALAAYNVGFGHLLDARRLTRAAGLDASHWDDVRQYLPRLLQPEYYSRTRHGYARAGAESVAYVRNVRHYYDALVWVSERNNLRHVPVPQDLLALQGGLVH